jgi:hypothetical protein
MRGCSSEEDSVICTGPKTSGRRLTDSGFSIRRCRSLQVRQSKEACLSATRQRVENSFENDHMTRSRLMCYLLRQASMFPLGSSPLPSDLKVPVSGQRGIGFGLRFADRGTERDSLWLITWAPTMILSTGSASRVPDNQLTPLALPFRNHVERIRTGF